MIGIIGDYSPIIDVFIRDYSPIIPIIGDYAVIIDDCSNHNDS